MHDTATTNAPATLKVRDMMTERVFSLLPSDSLRDARELMWEHNVRHVPVVDEERDLVGLLSHRDLLRFTQSFGDTMTLADQNLSLEEARIADLMIDEVATVEPDTDVRTAAGTMLENKFGCLPVVDGTRLAGILTESDFVRLLAAGD